MNPPKIDLKKIPKIDLKKVDELEKDPERVKEIVERWAGRLRSPTLPSARSTLPSVVKNP
ncbi:MAG: hypothetical protein ACE5J9_02990 [Methanosarcinales archaeon]